MSIPKLKKIKSEKKYHDLTLSDEYSWVDQPNILEVLKDTSKLDSEVKDYINTNNKIIMFNLYIRIYHLTLIIKEHTRRQIKHTLQYT